jgi:sulfoxide reductase heme-binding subunit YedZ
VSALQQIRLVWKPVIFVLCLLPLGFVLLQAFEVGPFHLGPNPVEDIQDEMGIWTLRLFMATLAVTPLRHITGKVWLIRFRRMLGLFAFTYCALHFLNYLVLDQTLNFPEIIEDIIKRPFITVGFVALLLMIPLAITSTNGWRRRLGPEWTQLHRLTYGIGVLGCWHFYWQVKKDLTEPLIYVAILTMLLGFRIWRLYQRRSSAA